MIGKKKKQQPYEVRTKNKPNNQYVTAYTCLVDRDFIDMQPVYGDYLLYYMLWIDNVDCIQIQSI